MKQTLINKYMAGTATVHEEEVLRQVLMSVPREELSADEKVMLQLLSSHTPMEEDVFDADYSEEYERIVGSSLQTPPKRGFGKWWKYASVAAAIALVCGTFVYFSQKETDNEQQMAKALPTASTIDDALPHQEQIAQIQEPTALTEKEERMEHEPPAAEKGMAESGETIATLPMKENEQSRQLAEAETLESDITSMQMLDIDLAEVDIKGQDLREAITAMNEELFANY